MCRNIERIVKLIFECFACVLRSGAPPPPRPKTEQFSKPPPAICAQKARLLFATQFLGAFFKTDKFENCFWSEQKQF